MKPVNKTQIKKLIIENSNVIRQYGVKAIGLFGSFVRNEQNDKSDIDILVEFEQGKKTYTNFIELAYYLEDLFGRKVELLTLQSISPYIRPRILKEVEYIDI